MRLREKTRNQIAAEVDFQYSRRSGPGGQKVNKTESQAELRWNLLASTALNEKQFQLVQDKLNKLINKDQELVLSSDQFRSRERNKQACLERLFEHIERALHIPKKRKKTKPSKASIEKRIQEKKRRGEKKRNRQKW